MAIPNITQWRRDTFSDLTSALGFPVRGVPQLPDTKRTLAQAVQNIATLPSPALPGATQSMPAQQVGPRPRPRPGA